MGSCHGLEGRIARAIREYEHEASERLVNSILPTDHHPRLVVPFDDTHHKDEPIWVEVREKPGHGYRTYLKGVWPDQTLVCGSLLGSDAFRPVGDDMVSIELENGSALYRIAAMHHGVTHLELVHCCYLPDVVPTAADDDYPPCVRDPAHGNMRHVHDGLQRCAKCGAERRYTIMKRDVCFGHRERVR